MKILKHIFPIAVLTLTGLFAACSPEDEQELPTYSPAIFSDDFEWHTKGENPQNTWGTNAVKGTKKWTFATFRNNSYLYFSAFDNPKEAENDTWVTSNELDIDKANLKRLTFTSTQGFVTDTLNNKLELYVLHNITESNADTVKLHFRKPQLNVPNFTWVNSGIVNLSQFKGKIKIAFRATGSGTDGRYDGTYEVDNIKVF